MPISPAGAGDDSRSARGGLPDDPPGSDRPWRIRWWPEGKRGQLLLAMAAAAFLILFRSVIFLLHGGIDFDSDQAVIGLMGKHLMERRAFPVFLYGQNYVLAVEAWLAAPVFFVAGVSIGTLKLPLLLINVAVGLLLVRLLQQEIGLSAAAAFVASLFFLLPPVATAATLLEAMGGNVEPLLYVLLLWTTRRRPAWFGLIAGIGFLQREFTAYGVAAIVVIELAGGRLRTREGWREMFASLRVVFEVWLVVQLLREFSTPAGPGTTVASLHAARNNIVEALGRFCVDPRTFAVGMRKLYTDHWAQLFGTGTIPLAAFGLNSRNAQGLAWSGLLLTTAMAVMTSRIAMLATPRDTAWWKRHEFCVYLMLVGVMSALTYALGRCGAISVFTMRYDLLSILGAVGLAGWFFSVERMRWIRHLATALIVVWAAVAVVPHVRLWSEYVPRAPLTAKEQIIRHLQMRGIRYVTADYWLAYYIAFATNEEIIGASSDLMRIPAYEQIVNAHKAESIFLSRTGCEGLRPEVVGVYFCPP